MKYKLLQLPHHANSYLLAVVVLPILSTSFVLAADIKLGEKLHNDNCIACHAAMTGGDGSVLYTRKDHRVDSFNALKKQIHRCQSSLDLKWTAEQLDNVQLYLNKNYYQY